MAANGAVLVYLPVNTPLYPTHTHAHPGPVPSYVAAVGGGGV